MELLTSRDFGRLFDLVRGCYGAGDAHDFVDRVLHDVGTVMPSEAVAVGTRGNFPRGIRYVVEDLLHIQVSGRLPAGVFVSVCCQSRGFGERDRLLLNTRTAAARRACEVASSR